MKKCTRRKEVGDESMEKQKTTGAFWCSEENE